VTKTGAFNAEKINPHSMTKNPQPKITKILLPLSMIRGVGPAITKSLIRLVGGDKIIDLLLHKPLRAEQISICPRIFEVQNDELIIIKAKVESHTKPASARQPYKVICYNPSGFITLVFFKIFPSQIAKMKIGDEIAILGNLQKITGENQISHPQEILPISEIEKMPKINVIYPLTYGVTQRFLNQKIRQVLVKIEDENEEWIDANLLKKKGWPSFTNAIKQLHYYSNSVEAQLSRGVEGFSDDNSFTGSTLGEERPTPPLTGGLSSEGSSTLNKGQKRLAYDELFAWQIAVLLAKNKAVKTKNFTKVEKDLAQDFLSTLPFDPTKSQLAAIAEIDKEIFSNKKMLRLLQGDVGSGKTIVAIAACLQNIAQNKQACIIAPTTVLAKQHFQYFKSFLAAFNLEIELLTSANTKKQKAKLVENLESGKINILIGTHALLEDDVKFKNLGLAVIDEQHRFGVMQRLKLTEKSNDVDVLLMSATPIPRSLMMALYGDMDISILNEKPKNRQSIETLVMSARKCEDSYQAIERTIAKGEKIYWICPAISIQVSEDGEVLGDADLAAVEERFEKLIKVFGAENVGLLHGKMKEKEKDKIMQDFAHGDLKILVSTTVIEVGIDVPDATVILIENAEHFGLSQLHQLRGRVGRSDKKSFCILLYGKKYGQNGKMRLNILRQSNDGFFIAEEDLKMRGSGELLGTKQSGFPEFRIADLSFDCEILKIARKNAEMVLSGDKDLSNENSQKYRDLLQIFKYDEYMKLMDGG
jgi:ATP-dependent DNA helicase RecG